jgi:hypothetical protein
MTLIQILLITLDMIVCNLCLFVRAFYPIFESYEQEMPTGGPLVPHTIYSHLDHQLERFRGMGNKSATVKTKRG